VNEEFFRRGGAKARRRNNQRIQKADAGNFYLRVLCSCIFLPFVPPRLRSEDSQLWPLSLRYFNNLRDLPFSAFSVSLYSFILLRLCASPISLRYIGAGRGEKFSVHISFTLLYLICVICLFLRFL
jgi:hypothetical protein